MLRTPLVRSIRYIYEKYLSTRFRIYSRYICGQYYGLGSNQYISMVNTTDDYYKALTLIWVGMNVELLSSSRQSPLSSRYSGTSYRPAVQLRPSSTRSSSTAGILWKGTNTTSCLTFLLEAIRRITGVVPDNSSYIMRYQGTKYNRLPT